MSTRSFLRLATLLGVTFAAYFVADLAHEGLGHGGACLTLGGKVILLTTTYEACSIRARLIDGAGPVVGLVVALLAWAWLRFARPASIAARTALCLTFAFAAFWNVGYLIKSGLTDEGDWAFVVKGLEPSFVWHAALAVLGVVLYALSMRMLGASILRALPVGGERDPRPFAFALTAYLAAGACPLSLLSSIPEAPPRPSPMRCRPPSAPSVSSGWAGHQQATARFSTRHSIVARLDRRRVRVRNFLRRSPWSRPAVLSGIERRAYGAIFGECLRRVTVDQGGCLPIS